MYRAMGSLAFTAAARAVWLVTRDPEDAERRLMLPVKMNLSAEPRGLGYRIVAGKVEWDDEPVDLHLIGHSQGAVVNSAALLALERITTPQLSAGFTRATFLDPHAASNGAPGQGDFVGGIEGWITRLATSAYQSWAGDPMVTIPGFVDEAEVYYQHTPVELDGLAWGSNLWGQAPLVGRARYSDLTDPADLGRVIAHAGEVMGAAADRLLSGEIAVKPYRLNRNTPCSWCSYKSICRHEALLESPRTLEPMKRHEVLARLAKGDARCEGDRPDPQC